MVEPDFERLEMLGEELRRDISVFRHSRYSSCIDLFLQIQQSR
jgi:hypothetical protein